MNQAEAFFNLPYNPGAIRVQLLDPAQTFGRAVEVLRLDTIHDDISGNKWFKLAPYLKEALERKAHTIVTAGGAWSNHLLATAAAASLCGMRSEGIVRGEEPKTLNLMLEKASGYGMQLRFTDRAAFHEIRRAHGLNDGVYTIPEGGYGVPGAEGASRILDFAPGNYSHLIAAAGTGTMIAGLVRASQPGQDVIGISILKGHHGLESEIAALTGGKNNFSVRHDFHFGGYARMTEPLVAFMRECWERFGLPLDRVYTAKAFYGLMHMLPELPPDSRVLFIHSGGLQGNASMPEGSLPF